MGREKMTNLSPIGVFDSGMGGLTVLKELRKELPKENFIYFGDTAHLPYGSKSPAAVRKYASNIADFLMGKKIKFLLT
ncbi:MAG: glutamate racemase, partial [Elusimicrobia bacterium]|nr:glutamate racemase [Elusimicrobiota bacterium]